MTPKRRKRASLYLGRNRTRFTITLSEQPDRSMVTARYAIDDMVVDQGEFDRVFRLLEAGGEFREVSEDGKEQPIDSDRIPIT